MHKVLAGNINSSLLNPVQGSVSLDADRKKKSNLKKNLSEKEAAGAQKSGHNGNWPRPASSDGRRGLARKCHSRGKLSKQNDLLCFAECLMHLPASGSVSGWKAIAV